MLIQANNLLTTIQNNTILKQHFDFDTARLKADKEVTVQTSLGRLFQSRVVETRVTTVE